jgi:membrane protein
MNFRFNWIDLFLKIPKVRTLREQSKHVSLPGFQGISIFDTLNVMYQELKKGDMTQRANSISFSFFIALFPSLIVLFTLIAYLPINQKFISTLNASIDQFMPGNVGNLLARSIKDILKVKRSGLLSLGFILAIYFSSNGMMAMMRGFEKSYGRAFIRRNIYQKRFWSFIMTSMLGILLSGSLIFLIYGNIFITWIKGLILKSVIKTLISKSIIAGLATILFFLLKWIVLISLFYFGISIIYRYGIAARNSKIGFFSPGTSLATIFSLLSSLGFSFYVDNFGNYNKIYGTIGSIIVLLLWIQLNVFILLVGFELNASIVINKHTDKYNKDMDDYQDFV